MRSTPQQTYLVERLQSARGLGWSPDAALLPFRKRERVHPMAKRLSSRSPGRPKSDLAPTGGGSGVRAGGTFAVPSFASLRRWLLGWA